MKLVKLHQTGAPSSWSSHVIPYREVPDEAGKGLKEYVIIFSFYNSFSQLLFYLIAALMLLSCDNELDKTSASDSNTHGFTASEKAVLCWCARKTEPWHGNAAQRAVCKPFFSLPWAMNFKRS